MVSYQYRCWQCGVYEVRRPMGEAPATCRCATCGLTGRRLYSAPSLARTPKAVGEALTRAEKSRDEPEVVTQVPPGASPHSSPSRPPPGVANLPQW